jgi:hypothetical protein
MLFQAHIIQVCKLPLPFRYQAPVSILIEHRTTLLLYRHFSPLDGLAIETIISCTTKPQVRIGMRTDTVHTWRTTQAARNISKLVTLPGLLVKHKHFFVCALTLSSITHLSLWTTFPVLTPDYHLKQPIRMNMGDTEMRRVPLT